MDGGGRGATMVAGGVLQAAGAFPEVAIPAALAVGTAGLLEAISANRAEYGRQTTQLRANVSGLRGDPMALGLDVAGIGHSYGFGRDVSENVTAQLGLAGVSGRQLPGALNATFALAAKSGVDPTQLAQLAASIVDAGGDVARTFRDLDKAAGSAGTSLGIMLQSMQALGQAGITSVNAAQLATVQSMLPKAAVAGQVFAPMMGASGFNMLIDAATSGMRPDEYLRAQGFNIRTGKVGPAQPLVFL